MEKDMQVHLIFSACLAADDLLTGPWGLLAGDRLSSLLAEGPMLLGQAEGGSTFI